MGRVGLVLDLHKLQCIPTRFVFRATGTVSGVCYKYPQNFLRKIEIVRSRYCRE